MLRIVDCFRMKACLIWLRHNYKKNFSAPFKKIGNHSNQK